ncbi:hypothetical protein K504DRAFT_456736 [Pleomassaria siparia CBS 279.74]|uniref:Uncharacterized protein n=1 Tax=Pleomassaria siparia CBS 279.74 TaxID=1314801 RepID=A0A6G1KPD3_9PLEO|nr:hypothetical protein K504DRAFT_456736 [Pleomassaria siparia CBS 279.74]
MVQFTYPFVLLAAVAVAQNITTKVYMTAPTVQYGASVHYSGSVVAKTGANITMVLTGSVIGPSSEQSSLDSQYKTGFNKQATRFTFQGTSGFEFKSASNNGMFNNIERCWEYGDNPNYPLRCATGVHKAWLETLCAEHAKGLKVPADKLKATRVDDVGETWTITASDAKWTSDCKEGSDYMNGPSASLLPYLGFTPFPATITAGQENLSQLGSAAAPTSTRTGTAASMTRRATSEAEPATSSIAASSTASESTAAPTQSTSAGSKNAPIVALVVEKLVQVLIS